MGFHCVISIRDHSFGTNTFDMKLLNLCDLPRVSHRFPDQDLCLRLFVLRYRHRNIDAKYTVLIVYSLLVSAHHTIAIWCIEHPHGPCGTLRRAVGETIILAYWHGRRDNPLPPPPIEIPKMKFIPSAKPTRIVQWDNNYFYLWDILNSSVR